MSFCILPNEILLIIFSYCNMHDLLQLKRVCKKFCHLTSELFKKTMNLLVTSEMSEKFRERCQSLLPYKLKLSINYNWKHGIYESKICYPKPLSTRRKLYPQHITIYEDNCWNCLQMTKDNIWFVSDFGRGLYAFNRTKNLVSDDNWIVGECDSNIADIASCNDVTVTYHMDGSIRQWTVESLDKRQIFNKKLLRSSCPKEWPCNIDMTSRNIITSSKINGITLWKYIPQENFFAMENKIVDPYDSGKTSMKIFAFDPIGTKFIAYYQLNEHAYFVPHKYYIIYDINKGFIKIYDDDYKDLTFHPHQILWEDPNTILLLKGDQIAKMDFRTHKTVQKWNAPFCCQYTNSLRLGDITFTCMSSDNQYAIMTGTCHGQLFLWDQRQSAYIQTYEAPHKKEHIHNNTDLFKRGICNYVDSLKFDSSHMYVATDGIYKFDFTKM